MHKEFDSIMDNGTLKIVDLHACRAVVNIMWIFKIKSDPAGEISGHKARFVAKGWSKRADLD
jgi:hypothetical protein